MPKHVLGLLLTALSLSGCQLIQDQLDGNQAPAFSDLGAEPAEGQAPLLVGFSWNADDVEGDTLSCTLVYGNERQQVENCGEVTNTFHTFEEPGRYTVVLRVDDGLNTAARSVAVRVLKPEIK
jgi:cellulose 1,4-beta-cellobiosidase